MPDADETLEQGTDEDTKRTEDEKDAQRELAEGLPNAASAKPRTVSFNRDVHVKRIAPSRPAPPASPPAVRRQSLGGLSKQQLAREAEKVLQQASRATCHSTGLPPDRFHSLPVRGRRRNRPTLDINSSSPPRRRSEELGVTSNFPVESLKSSLARSVSDVSSKKPKKNTLLNLFKKSDKEDAPPQPQGISKTSNITVKRSKSDVSDLKSSIAAQKPVRKRTGSESEEYLNSVTGKKTQLSPIIEASQGDDYFKSNNTKLISSSGNNDIEKIVLETSETPRIVTSTPEYKVNPVEKPPRTKEPKPPARPKRAKTLTGKDEYLKQNKKPVNTFGTLPKSNSRRKLLVDEIQVKSKDLVTKDIKKSIKDTISCLQNKSQSEKPPEMIHSSQKPPDKLPLTKGQAVDTMIRILNNDKFSPPPKASLLAPTHVAAHNVNQPFSYTKPSVSPDPNLYMRSLSPERIPSPINKTAPETGHGIIYAQVVCGNGEKSGMKQTVHTTVAPGRQRPGQHSDEDEGLGYEENRVQTSYSRDVTDFSYSGQKIGDDPYRHLEDYVPITDSPITPRFKEYKQRSYLDKEPQYANEYPPDEGERDRYRDYERSRGRDEPDTRRRDNSADPDDLKYDKKKAELSHRRELLESRLNARKNRDQTSPGTRYTPEKEFDVEDANPVEATKRYVSEMTKYYREDGNVKSGFSDEYTLNTSRDKDGTLSKTEHHSKSKFNPETALFEPVLGQEIDRREFIDRRLAEEPPETKYFAPQKPARYFPPEPEYEPPSLDSQVSVPRYSPDIKKYKTRSSRFQGSSQDGLNTQSRYVSSKHKQEKFANGRDHYASNPEIVKRGKSNLEEQYDPNRPETYHNSLRRNKHNSSDKHFRNQIDYLEQTSSRSLRQHDSEERRDLGYGGETSGPESSRSRYDTDRDRDNKFADSGIENDYRKDSNGDIHSRRAVSSSKVLNARRSRGDLRNESEDEGFASSLLIASERQHTEDNHSPPKSRYASDYDQENSEYRQESSYRREHIDSKRIGSRREEFVHRERSIDDGSFYDPRIDKFEDRKNAVEKIDSKPPKATKKISGLEKVKQLFSRDSSKKSKKVKESESSAMVREEDLRRRYTEYRGPSGSRERSRREPDTTPHVSEFDYSQRRRLATPPPTVIPISRRGSGGDNRRGSGREEPERSERTDRIERAERVEKTDRAERIDRVEKTTPKKVETSNTNGWFKSLDRLSRKKKDTKIEKESILTTTEEESNISPKRYTPSGSKGPTKSLRFFGDTDQESNGSGSKNNTLRRRPHEAVDKSTLTRSGKSLSSSVHALDRTVKAESKHRSSSLTNLQNGSPAFDSRQNLLANSYSREKYSNGKRDLHNISEIHSNSEDESQLRNEKEERIYENEGKGDGSTLKKPPMSPFREKRRSRSHSGSKTSKSTTLKSGYGGSRGDLVEENRGTSSSELQPSRHDVRGSRQELTGSRNDMRTRRRRAPQTGSPAGSSTEGESSLQSQRSVVYLHAPTVGDIPVTGRISRGRSRDDVSSINSSRLQPQTKTVSRSFSVLAPWKPRFYREAYDINYSQNQQSTLKRTEKPTPKQPPKKESSFLFGKSKSASTKNLTSSKYDVRSSEERSGQNRTGTSTLSRRPNTSTNGRVSSSNGTSTLRKTDVRSRTVNGSSKENINHNIGTLSKSRNDLRSRDYKKSLSSDVLERDTPPKGMKRSSVERERLSRSISMPKDPNKSAGWFKITKKSKKTESTNRL